MLLNQKAYSYGHTKMKKQIYFCIPIRNTAILGSKYCQFDCNLDKIWRQSYSNWQYFKLQMAAFTCVFE